MPEIVISCEQSPCERHETESRAITPHGVLSTTVAGPEDSLPVHLVQGGLSG